MHFVLLFVLLIYLWMIARDKRNIFLIFHETICCGYLLEHLNKALLMSTHSMFSWRNNKNNHAFWLKKAPYLELSTGHY